MGVVVSGLFVLLGVRLFALQVLGGPALRKDVIATSTRSVTFPAPRGLILGDDGKTVLAGDIEQNVALMTTTIGPNGEREGNPTAEINLSLLVSGLTENDIKAAINNNALSPYAPVVVSPPLTDNQVLEIDDHRSSFPGVTVATQWQRTYPFDDLATQTLGYASPSSTNGTTSLVGKFGLEAEYNSTLEGSPRTEKVSIDPSGEVVGVQSSSPAVPGDNLILNMNVGLEQAASTALANEITSLHRNGYPAPWGAVTIEDPQNGAILALVSAPSYNDNLWEPGMTTAVFNQLENAPGHPFINYAVNSEQPPGSTFKLATAAAALNKGLINANTTIDDTGSYTLGNLTLHDSESSGLGNVNVVSAIAASSDVFFYNVGDWFYNDRNRDGLTPIQSVANSYGIDVPSGIDLPTDEVSPGWVDSYNVRKALHQQDPSAYGPATWFAADNVEMAFGQGETVTNTLEIANAYATFANGGTRYAPELVKAIQSANGKTLTKIKPKAMGRVNLPLTTKSLMAAGFTGAVQSPLGTATADFTGFNFATWNVAGKTGTATVSQNANAPTTGWFVSYGGPKDKPAKYVVAVEVDEAGYGASSAAPVARTIFNYLYQHPVTP